MDERDGFISSPEEKCSDSSRDPLNVSNDSQEEDIVTEWRKIIVAGVVTFLIMTASSIVTASEWAYLNTLDPSAPATFLGVIQSTGRAGHAVFSLLFSVWATHSNMKHPLLFGRLIAIAACCVYVLVETFQVEERRWVMLASYALIGVADSSAILVRSYIAAVSSTADRGKAYSLIAAANMAALLVGPACQLVFTLLAFPGVPLGPFRLHVYSLPVWTALAVNLFSLGLVGAVFREAPKRVRSLAVSAPSPSLCSRLRELRRQPFQWPLVLVLLFHKMCLVLLFITLMTSLPPIITASFGWSGAATVLTMSLSLIAAALQAIILTALIITGSIGRFSPRMSLCVAFLILFLMYFSTYPHSFLPTTLPVPVKQGDGPGCDPSVYSWCHSALAPAPALMLPIVNVGGGLAVPLATIAIDTLFSQVLGNIDQNFMQGVFVAVEDVMQIVTPLLSAHLYTSYGMAPLWGISVVVALAALVTAAITHKKFAKYSQ